MSILSKDEMLNLAYKRNLSARCVGYIEDYLYYVPLINALATPNCISELCSAWGDGELRGQEIFEYKRTRKTYIDYAYERENNVLDHMMDSIEEKVSTKTMKSDDILKELTTAASALIAKYNAVIQDREWVAMQSVSKANGFTYRGPWIAKEIEDLAKIIENHTNLEKAMSRAYGSQEPHQDYP